MKKLFALLILLPGLGLAQDLELDRDVTDLFWQLYPEGGWTLYCGEFFDQRSKITMEPVYSLNWASKSLACDNQQQCRETQPKFLLVEADLHNLYPALPMIVQARKDDQYGMVLGEYREFFECDFEHDGKDHIVEPRVIARGNIARSLFYMHDRYQLPIQQGILEMLLEWNHADPPSKDEKRRNDLIEKIQGSRNPFIDNSAAVEKFRDMLANSQTGDQ